MLWDFDHLANLKGKALEGHCKKVSEYAQRLRKEYNVMKKEEGQQRSEGWICPKCGRVWAVWIKECEWCNQWMDFEQVRPTTGTDWEKPLNT